MLKVGMVGIGGISTAHLGGWDQIPEATITALCDIRPEAVEAAAERFSARTYLSLDDMLEKEKLDILDICVPTYLHADFAVKAMERGIHVLMEKPISLRREDVERVYRTAARNGVSIMVAQVLRFWSEYVYLKALIDEGTYGKVISGCMTRLGNVPRWSWDGWMNDPARSGLVPYDLHIHDLDFMVYAFGRPEKVVSHRGVRKEQDYIKAIYEYPNFFITGEAAWFDCDYPFRAGFRFQLEQAVVELRDGVLKVYPSSSAPFTVAAEAGKTVNGINLPASNAYYNEIRYFTDCVLEGRFPDTVKPEELETVLDLIEQL